MRCLTNSTRAHLHHVFLLLTQLRLMGKIQIHSRRTFKMKTSYATDELAQFFVTEPTNASNKLSLFYCRVCWKKVSVLTHGSSEILLHFQGIRHFATDQRLRLETLDGVSFFDGKPLTEEKLKRQRGKKPRTSLVVRDGEYPFQEDLILDASKNVDPQLPLLANVSSLVAVLHRMGAKSWSKVFGSKYCWRPAE